MLLWLQRGKACLKIKKYDEAIISWQKILSIDPNFIEAWTLTGITYIGINSNAEAINAFDFMIWLLKFVGPGLDSFLLSPGQKERANQLSQNASDGEQIPPNFTLKALNLIIDNSNSIQLAKYGMISAVGALLMGLSIGSVCADEGSKITTVKFLGNLFEAFVPGLKFGFLFKDTPWLIKKLPGLLPGRPQKMLDTDTTLW